MRLVAFRDRDRADGGARLGLLGRSDPSGEANEILPLDALPWVDADEQLRLAVASGDVAVLLAADPDLAATRAALERSGDTLAGLDRSSVRLLAPLRRPAKIVCVGLNYRDHVEEQRVPLPERPILFAKFANAIVGDGDPIVHHEQTRALDLEAELGVVIGQRVRRVAPADAWRHVAGYTVVNDVSARDLQGVARALAPGERGDGQWLRAKGSDTFCPLGPAFVTADEVADPGRLRIRSSRTELGDGPAGHAVPMQDGTTSDMIFGIPTLIAYVSSVITLEPGDLIATGTPAGVGVFRDPPVFLRPGDLATVEVDGIGRLTNPVVSADGTAPAGTPAARFLAERS